MGLFLRQTTPANLMAPTPATRRPPHQQAAVLRELVPDNLLLGVWGSLVGHSSSKLGNVLLLVFFWRRLGRRKVGLNKGWSVVQAVRKSVLTDANWLLWLSWAHADHVSMCTPGY
jgi:hypothetical protein